MGRTGSSPTSLRQPADVGHAGKSMTERTIWEEAHGLRAEISCSLTGTCSGGISMKWNTAGSGSRIAIPVSGGKESCCELFARPHNETVIRISSKSICRIPHTPRSFRLKKSTMSESLYSFWCLPFSPKTLLFIMPSHPILPWLPNYKNTIRLYMKMTEIIKGKDLSWASAN